MKIVLVNPPTLYFDKFYLSNFGDIQHTPYYKSLVSRDETKKDSFSTYPGEHLGLQSLHASLLAEGHTVSIINACVELHTSVRQTLNQILTYQFDLIGFSGPLDVFAENLWLARSLRERGFTGHITLGHEFATLNHQILLQHFPEFDSVVRGEGEHTICQLAYHLENHLPLHSIDGISFREKQSIIVRPPRPVIADIDTLPWVTRTHTKRVLDLGLSASIFSKRGCPYKCSFCTTGRLAVAEGIKGTNRWRQRSATKVVDELEFLQDTY